MEFSNFGLTIDLRTDDSRLQNPAAHHANNSLHNNNKYSTSIDSEHDLNMNGKPYHLNDQFVFSKKTALLNIVVHLLLFGVAGYVTYQSASSNVLFSLHPALLSFGYLVLMSQAILTMSDNNFFTYKVEFKYRLLLHWLLPTIAGIMITVGAVCIFKHKINLGKQHFTTTHSLVGLTTVSCTLLSIILGVFTKYSYPLRDCVRPVCTKILHSMLGVITYILAMVTIGFGIYSGFFTQHSNEYVQGSLLGIIVATSLYILVKPVALICARLKEVVSR